LITHFNFIIGNYKEIIYIHNGIQVVPDKTMKSIFVSFFDFILLLIKFYIIFTTELAKAHISRNIRLQSMRIFFVIKWLQEQCVHYFAAKTRWIHVLQWECLVFPCLIDHVIPWPIHLWSTIWNWKILFCVMTMLLFISRSTIVKKKHRNQMSKSYVVNTHVQMRYYHRYLSLEV
jgi:hypothetical protein